MPQSKIIPETFERSLDGNAIAVICEDSSVRFLNESDSEVLYSVLTCAEDDSRTWKDFQLLWPRSIASDAAPASIDDLPWETLDLNGLVQTLEKRTGSSGAANWIAIELHTSTIFTGAHGPWLLGQEDRYNAPHGSEKEYVIQFEHAPWWSIQRDVAPSTLHASGRKKTVRSEPNRTVLWGDEWLDFLSSELAKLAKIGVSFNEENSYPVILKIHKAWLLTPRASLKNQTPREQLHIAKDWISNLNRSQLARIDEGLEPIPLPLEFSGYETAPMGKNEVIIYFDANRDLLEYGYNWIIKNISSRKSKKFEQELKTALTKRFRRWREELDDEGLSPAFVVQFERQRLPLMSLDVEHIPQCDCPICQVMASGSMGIGLIIYDGLQLELDEDFTFSIYATQSEWEEEFGYLTDDDDEFDEGDDDYSDDEEIDDEDGDDEDGDDAEVGDDSGFEAGLAELENMSGIASPSANREGEETFDERIWTTKTPEEMNLPGKLGEKLGLAFLFAEFTSELESVSRSRMKMTEDSNRLVELHGLFCMALETKRMDAARKHAGEIKNIMEKVAQDHPPMISRVADLTSRIDEELRKQRA